MNAIPPARDRPDPERTARHLAMLRELAEIGMALARAIGEQALAALEAPPPDPETPQPEAPPSPAPNRADPGLAFARVARAVRQCIALEARIAAGPLPAPRGRAAPQPAPDPRREHIRRVVRLAAEADGLSFTALKREIDERLDDELEADPDGDTPVEEIIFAIIRDFGLARDLAHQPDEVIAILAGPGPDEADPLDPDATATPTPTRTPASTRRPRRPGPPAPTRLEDERQSGRATDCACYRPNRRLRC